MKTGLERLGYRIGRTPPLASELGYALELDFDYVLAHYLGRRDNTRPFFFVQVGAFDGVTHDPLYEHVRRGRWHGVLVEPHLAPLRGSSRTTRIPRASPSSSRADWDEAVKLLARHGYRVLREEYDTTAYSAAGAKKARLVQTRVQSSERESHE